MEGLLTKEDVKVFLGLKTIEATDKMLKRLNVPKVNFSLVGGKGIRYRRSDIEEAVSKMEIHQHSSSTRRKPRRRSLYFLICL